MLAIHHPGTRSIVDVPARIVLAVGLAAALVAALLVPAVNQGRDSPAVAAVEATTEGFRDLVFGATAAVSSTAGGTILETSYVDGGRATAVVNSRPAGDAVVFDVAELVPGAATIHLNADGGVDVVGATGEVMAVVAAPWAVDANGAEVGTSYTTDGTILTQHLALDGETAYPVTADPRFHWSWGRLYVTWYRGEALWMTGLGWTALAAAIGAMCAGPHVVPCAAAVGSVYYVLKSLSDWAVGRLYDRGCALETRIIPWPNTKWKC